ncbi:MAG: FGGY-family carbohydrate kinase [Cetobacterium sp.]|nr:FGGY-family carbohydrate kinase [Cetobacterium sp.]
MERLIVSEYFNKYSIKLTSKNDILAIAYNSLGYQYKQSLELIENLSKKKIETLLLLGGGNQDSFLIETIKKYLNLPIEIGPVEASATGNALEQFKYIL